MPDGNHVPEEGTPMTESSTPFTDDRDFSLEAFSKIVDEFVGNRPALYGMPIITSPHIMDELVFILPQRGDGVISPHKIKFEAYDEAAHMYTWCLCNVQPASPASVFYSFAFDTSEEPAPVPFPWVQYAILFAAILILVLIFWRM